jgi:hypothetical protein
VTLAEIAIAILLLAVILLPLLGVFLKSVRGIEVTWQETRAVTLAEQVMETIKSLPWDGDPPTVGTPPVVALAFANIGNETFTPPDYNDVDDFNGFTDVDPVGRLTRTVVVDFVTANLTGGKWVIVSSMGAVTDLKRVRVTVTGDGNRVLAWVTTLRANLPGLP